MSTHVDGYITDVPYVRAFIHELAPAWLDHVAVVSGIMPPARRDGFTWCDLGCGQGLTAAMLAAMHPAGQFHGVDAMLEHVEHGQGIAAEAAICNVHFHAADFANATELSLPQFDYIVSHGVYSWISPLARAAVRSFIESRLKPGGLVYLSYNAMPGRAADLPLQRLVRAIGEICQGDSTQRVVAALKVVKGFLELKAPALVASPMLAGVKERHGPSAVAYLAHEFMGKHWDPLFVTEVRSEMATIGLRPVGSATLIENHDAFVLGQAARAALVAIADDDVRELARDFLIDQFFRRDIFVRAGANLDEQAQQQRLLDGSFLLARPDTQVEYTFATPAGRLAFDNAAARGIVMALAAGPCRLRDIVEQVGVIPMDVIANAMVLCASTQIRPVEPTHADVAPLNAVISRRLGCPEEVTYLALPCGTAVSIDSRLRAVLRGETADGPECEAWRTFLAAHGI
ncbi:class I SAM-dependent methyltransferase [Bradyrhizobium sp. UFLA05-112]